MKFLSPFFAVLAVAVFNQGSANQLTKPYFQPLPENASFTGVGSQCTIFSVAFPTTYLFMEEMRFLPYVLQMRKGNPKLESTGQWDWRGIWKIQKYNNERSVKPSYQFMDYKTKTKATFAPKDEVPQGSRGKVRGTLWILNVETRNSVQTTIRSAVGLNWFLTALIDPWTNTPTVEMTLQDQGTYSSWKITCDDDGRNK